jgi:hypothetical protein
MESKSNINPQGKPNPKKVKFNIGWIYGIIIFALFASYLFGDKVPVKEINSYPVFKQYVQEGLIESIEVYPQKNQVEAVVKDSVGAM